MPSRRIETVVYIEHANTLEDMGHRIREVEVRLGEKGCVVASVSHAIDEADPQGRFQFIVVGRTLT